MGASEGQRRTHYTVRAAELRLTSPPGVTPADEFIIVEKLAAARELPLALAALLNFAHNTSDEAVAGKILKEPQLLLGDAAPRVLELGNIIEGYDYQTDNYLGDAGRDAFPTVNTIKAKQRRARNILLSIYQDLEPERAQLYAKAANYVGGMTATIALLRRHKDNIYDRHANIPPLAATAAMELAASVDISFEPHVLQVFPHPETKEPLTIATFERRTG